MPEPPGLTVIVNVLLEIKLAVTVAFPVSVTVVLAACELPNVVTDGDDVLHTENKWSASAAAAMAVAAPSSTVYVPSPGVVTEPPAPEARVNDHVFWKFAVIVTFASIATVVLAEFALPKVVCAGDEVVQFLNL